jgi:hypothetical protein
LDGVPTTRLGDSEFHLNDGDLRHIWPQLVADQIHAEDFRFHPTIACARELP